MHRAITQPIAWSKQMILNVAAYRTQLFRPEVSDGLDGLRQHNDLSETFCPEENEADQCEVLPMPHVAANHSRAHQLATSCPLMADGFTELDEVIQRYVSEVPQLRFDSEQDDLNRFLNWVESEDQLNEGQRDLVTYVKAHHSVEYLAMKQRLAHLRFCTQVAENEMQLRSLNLRSRQQIHLNPIHVVATLESHAMLATDVEVPCQVIFYLYRGQVEQFVLTDSMEVLLAQLNRGGMSVQRALRNVPRASRESLLQQIATLAQKGVLALT